MKYKAHSQTKIFKCLCITDSPTELLPIIYYQEDETVFLTGTS